ncbi:hypothetical protein B296_00030431 [Ensete ventricosum]|uniref:Secreted protein n=1 Tax=Ensete ventricosum TaxID=4639 RepID=A0A426YLG8_ENSVE|nr:hypothetical protein B296_00030431 [Ensete ventricosum]
MKLWHYLFTTTMPQRHCLFVALPLRCCRCVASLPLCRCSDTTYSLIRHYDAAKPLPLHHFTATLQWHYLFAISSLQCCSGVGSLPLRHCDAATAPPFTAVMLLLPFNAVVVAAAS